MEQIAAIVIVLVMLAVTIGFLDDSELPLAPALNQSDRAAAQRSCIGGDPVGISARSE